MRRRTILLVSVALIGPALVPAGEPARVAAQEDPASAARGFEVQHYALDLRWDADSGVLTGAAILDALAGRTLGTIDLDFVGFTIDSVQVDGRLARFARDNGTLTVHPAGSLPAGQPFTIEITYRGVPERIDYGRSGWIERFGYVAALGAQHTWYPTAIRQKPQASYSVRVTVPKPLVAVANGRLHEQTDQGDATTFAWESAGQLRSLSLHIGDFATREAQGPNGLPLRYYLPRGQEAFLLERLDSTPEMIAFFEERFGPFPYPVYTLVVSPAAFGSTALKTLTVLPTSGVTPGIMAHELTHQWAGHSVRPASSEDLWLAEGLATFAEDLWREHLGACCARLKPVEIVRYLPPRVGGNTESAYQRGGWAFRALQVEVGDEVLFDVLQEFHERYAGELVQLDDLINVADEISGRLRELFVGWLIEDVAPPIPVLRLGTDDKIPW